MAHIGGARSDVAATSLGKEGLTFVGSEPSGKGLEGRSNVVSNTLSMGSRIIRIEILVNIKDQVGSGSVGVGDSRKCCS